jgi:hypothetical protein
MKFGMKDPSVFFTLSTCFCVLLKMQKGCHFFDFMFALEEEKNYFNSLRITDRGAE